MDRLEPAKLYYFDASPFARLCRVLIDEWHVPVQMIDVSYPLPDDFFKINPLGQVPTLKTIGETIFPTSQIVEQLWAMTEEAQEPFLDPLADRQLLAIILELSDFLVNAVHIEFAGLETVGENRLGFDMKERDFLRVQNGLDWLEDRAGTWLTGDEPNVCDYALTCLLLWSDSRRPITWRNRKNIADIVDRLAERPSFKSTVPAPMT
ncbi:MAG: glutathione S-transferase family protein [Amylibacter sp.]|nr:glutathione S-transferase family protein [Amylibacter sp.]